ncbi:MAG: hypothetical protein ABIO69_00370 [Sphingomicrobium sp.]
MISRVNPRRRRHLVPALSTERFIERLNERKIDYVLLGDTPDNLEVLVSDDHLDRLRDLVTLWPIGAPVSIYTPSARPGTSYTSPLAETHPRNRMAIFPRRIAEGLLRRAVARPGQAKVMDARDALFACAYRAAYMEATCCEWSKPEAQCAGCRPFDAELKRLAALAGVALPEQLSAQSLDQMLEHEGWRPPLDLLEKASEWAPWIRDSFPALQSVERTEPAGVAVFFIRERAIENGLKSEILETLKEKGFDLIHVVDLDEQDREGAGNAFRGGNWGMGSWKRDGGRPGCIVVGLDLLPLPVSGDLADLHPFCDDLKIIRAKVAVRQLVNANLPGKEQYNGLHSTDNSDQSWRVVRQLFPEQEDMLRDLVKTGRAKFPKRDAVRDLTRYGSRAQVALIEHRGTLAIRKTFRPGALRYMEREADVMETLAPVCPEVPKLLARADDHIIIEYVGESAPLPPWPHPLPLSVVRQLARFIKTCVAHGYDPIDMKPSGNVLMTKTGIKVIDYEFWRRCDPATPPEKCFCMAGLPRDYTGDRPRGVLFLYDPYPAQWFRYTALSVDSFLHDPAWLQLVKRQAHLSRRYGLWLTRAVGRRVLRGSFGSKMPRSAAA